MNDHLPLVEVEKLKQKIADAMRTTLREFAHERGMSVGDFISSLIKTEHSTPRLQAARPL